MFPPSLQVMTTARTLALLLSPLIDLASSSSSSSSSSYSSSRFSNVGVGVDDKNAAAVSALSSLASDKTPRTPSYIHRSLQNVLPGVRLPSLTHVEGLCGHLRATASSAASSTSGNKSADKAAARLQVDDQDEDGKGKYKLELPTLASACGPSANGGDAGAGDSSSSSSDPFGRFSSSFSSSSSSFFPAAPPDESSSAADSSSSSTSVVVVSPRSFLLTLFSLLRSRDPSDESWLVAANVLEASLIASRRRSTKTVDLLRKIGTLLKKDGKGNDNDDEGSSKKKKKKDEGGPSGGEPGVGLGTSVKKNKGSNSGVKRVSSSFSLVLQEKVLLDEQESLRHSAMSKISSAASVFNTDRMSLSGFKTGDMTKSQFGTQLRVSLHVSLTVPELDAVTDIFDVDGDGQISAAEFLNLFFRIKGQGERERRGTLERVKGNVEARKERDKTKEGVKHKAECERAVEPFKREDLVEAVGKIAVAAAKWERGTSGGTALKGFQGELDAVFFREQLWRAFDVVFTKPELGALIDAFDVKRNGTVDGCEFLNLFFRLQKKEKQWESEQTRRRAIKKTAFGKARELEGIAKEEVKQQAAADPDFAQEDLDAGLAKIKAAANRVGKRGGGAGAGAGPSPLSAFTDGPAMLPHVFRSNLARFLGVFLTPKQVGALVEHFDKDKDGTVDGAEFLKAALGTWSEDASDKARLAVEHKNKFLQDAARKDKDKEDKVFRDLNCLQLVDASPDDVASAMRKIRKAAYSFDSRVTIGLGGFQGPPMTPYQFRDLLYRTFAVRLSLPELAALFNAINVDGGATIDGAEFLSAFFTLRRDEQLKEGEAARRSRRRREEEAEKARRKENNAGSLRPQPVVPFGEAARRAALDKIRDAALRFNPRNQSLEGFKTGGNMSPAELKAELRRALNVKLNREELSSIVCDWADERDAAKDGGTTLAGARFIANFMRFRWMNAGVDDDE